MPYYNNSKNPYSIKRAEELDEHLKDQLYEKLSDNISKAKRLLSDYQIKYGLVKTPDFSKYKQLIKSSLSVKTYDKGLVFKRKEIQIKVSNISAILNEVRSLLQMTHDAYLTLSPDPITEMFTKYDDAFRDQLLYPINKIVEPVYGSRFAFSTEYDSSYDFNNLNFTDDTKDIFEIPLVSIKAKERNWYYDKHNYGPLAKKLEIYKEQKSNVIDIYAKNKLIMLPNFKEQHYAEQYLKFAEPFLRKLQLNIRAGKKQIKKREENGFVYVMSNKAYPGIYKIGSTYGDPEERAEELTGTGHLHPFKVEMSYEMKDAEYYEKSIHKILEKNRVNKNREFFDIDLSVLKGVLIKLSDEVNNSEERIEIDDLKEFYSL